MVDYVSGESHGTRGYWMKDRAFFSSGDLGSPDGTAARSGLAGLFDQWLLADGATQSVAGTRNIDAWGPGTVVLIRVWFAIDIAQTGSKAVRLRLRAGCHAPGSPGSGTGLSFSIDTTIDALVDNIVSNLTYADFAISLPHARGAALSVLLSRIGGHANDNVSAGTGLFIHGIEAWFRGTGPDSAGSGTYALGD
jgi:hypothetical protein